MNLIFFLQYCILSSTIIHCRSVLLSFELTWWSLHYYNLAVIIKPLGSPVNVMIPGVKPKGLVGPRLSSWFKHTRGFTVNIAGLYLQSWISFNFSLVCDYFGMDNLKFLSYIRIFLSFFLYYILF